jgi:hypothetical protein
MRRQYALGQEDTCAWMESGYCRRRSDDITLCSSGDSVISRDDAVTSLDVRSRKHRSRQKKRHAEPDATRDPLWDRAWVGAAGGCKVDVNGP